MRLNETKFSTYLLTIFFLIWCWTEFTESVERTRVFRNIEGFVNEGPRFTADDAKELELRITELENKE